MEKYRLIFTGERCGNFAKLPLEKHLKLIKLSERASTKIMAGSKVALKSGLTPEAMQQQKEAFEKIGLVTQQQLQLDADILSSGLRPKQRDLEQLDLGPINTALAVYELADTLTPPTIFSRPQEALIKPTSEQDSSKCPITVEQDQYQFNSLLLIALAASLGLMLQTYIVVVITAFIETNIIATLGGVIFLLCSVAILPRLFQPLLASTLRVDEKRIELFEQLQLILGKKRIHWETPNALGEFIVSTDKATATSVELIYEWQRHYHLDDISDAAIDDIQSAITEGTVIEVAQSVFDKLTPLIMRFMPNKEESEIDWEQEPASAVCNANGDIVAIIYQGKNAAYRIIRECLQGDLVLHAFCLSIHRADLA